MRLHSRGKRPIDVPRKVKYPRSKAVKHHERTVTYCMVRHAYAAIGGTVPCMIV